MDSVFGGLDLSYTGTGMVVLDGARVIQKRLETQTKDWPNPVARLAYLRDSAVSFFEGCDPELICIEGYAHGSGHGREMAGELGGVVRVALAEAGFRFAIIPPTTLKAFATGKGTSKKEVMLLEVYKRWGFETHDHDINDAFALAQLAKSLSAPRAEWTKGFSKLCGKVTL